MKLKLASCMFLPIRRKPGVKSKVARAAFGLLCLFLLLAPPLMAKEPSPQAIGPDPLLAANDFITAFTGSTPAALGYAADASELTAIGKAVLEGKYSDAMNRVGEFTAGKLLLSAAPGIGQVVAIGNLGKAAGDAAANWTGQKNFQKLYSTLLETVGPVKAWPETPEAAMKDPFFAAAMIAEYRYLETWLIKEGYAPDREGAEKVAVEMLLAKGRFENLCDEHGLKGGERTLENLRSEMEIEAEVSAELAREAELARAARLEEERQRKEGKAKEKEKPEAETSADGAAAKPLLVPTMPSDYPQDLEKPLKPAPPAVPAPPAAKPDKAPKKTPKETPAKNPLQWTVQTKKMDGDSTFFTVSVTNESKEAVKGFSASLAPLNATEDGGAGWGSPPSVQTLPPGGSVEISAFAMGKTKGVVISFAGNQRSLGSVTALSVHSLSKKTDSKKTDSKKPDRTYKGCIGGEKISPMTLVISGRSVTFQLVRSFVFTSWDWDHFKAEGKGTYDPASGIIKAEGYGILLNKDGSKSKLKGRIVGQKSGEILTGKFYMGELSSDDWEVR